MIWKKWWDERWVTGMESSLRGEAASQAVLPTTFVKPITIKEIGGYWYG